MLKPLLLVVLDKLQDQRLDQYFLSFSCDCLSCRARLATIGSLSRSLATISAVGGFAASGRGLDLKGMHKAL